MKTTKIALNDSEVISTAFNNVTIKLNLSVKFNSEQVLTSSTQLPDKNRLNLLQEIDIVSLWFWSRRAIEIFLSQKEEDKRAQIFS